ncbi:MAG: molybdenum cofactor guanylyltransferase [Gemmatimonadales bacterium]
MAATDVRGAILAGGRATRYGGEPKGLISIGGRRIIDRLAAECEAAFGAPPLLVANAPGAAAWIPGLTVVADVVAEAGALGGLLTAVVAAPAPVVCVAWDMPFVTAALLRRLAEGLARADACLPESDGPRGVEPLCAGYGQAADAAIRRAIGRGDLRAVGFHDGLRIERVPLAEIAGFGDPARLFFNVNRPEDAESAEYLARK